MMNGFDTRMSCSHWINSCNKV
uniref:Uncharacterized protein n=1 Tax=Arundo donax TaxID=35708 RepID=A0A0A9GX89_ARUDO